MAAVREELGDLDGVSLGIGPVLAAAAAAAVIERYRPAGVVLVGTCGAYRREPAIGTAIVAARFGLAFGVAAMGLGYVPRPPAPIGADEALLERLVGPRASVLTCGAVTTDPTLAERLADGWDVEHLEAFGVAAACQAAGIPFAAVLGVANLVGPDAHTEWLTHRDAAQEAARRVVRDMLEDGGLQGH
jgi:purine-nucleoside phosphorylase